MSEMSESDAFGQGETVRNVRCVLRHRTDGHPGHRTGGHPSPALGHLPPALPPDVLELATLLRETFGPLRISGPLVGKPDPEWTRWPSHTAADMAPSAWPSVTGRRTP